MLSCRQFFFNYRQVRKTVVRILPPGPQSRSATFWSAVYPFAGPQVRSPHFTPGPCNLHYRSRASVLKIQNSTQKQTIIACTQLIAATRLQYARRPSLSTKLQAVNSYKHVFYQYFCHRPKMKPPVRWFPPLLLLSVVRLVPSVSLFQVPGLCCPSNLLLEYSASSLANTRVV